METREVNGHIALFGESVKRFFRAQKRSEMTSPMFNLPGRLLLGSYCYYENLPHFVTELLRHSGAEEIGRSMKRLCQRPNYVHLNSLALGYLVGRQQLRLAKPGFEGDDAGTALVMDFWSRAARHYRNDGCLLPDETDFSVPILPAPVVDDLNAHLRDSEADGLRRQIHRLMATTELYTFILHGEARVGVFHHGPYPLGGKETLVVKELVGLKEDFYPWAQFQGAMPCGNIACVMRLRSVTSNIDLFGSMTCEPRDYVPGIVAEALFRVENGVYSPLPDKDIEAFTATTADAQLELYRQMIDWDDRYRIAYGAELYGYLLKHFGDMLDLGNAFTSDIRARFGESAGRHLDDLHSGREQALVLQHIAGTPGPIFSPLRDARGTGP